MSTEGGPRTISLEERERLVGVWSDKTLQEFGLSDDLIVKLGKVGIDSGQKLLEATPSELLRKTDFGTLSLKYILEALKKAGLYQGSTENVREALREVSKSKFKDL